MDIPDSILEQLRCSYCEEYLSYSPIYFHPFVGYICGRHSEQVAPARFMKQRKYELLASLMRFPCRHKQYGCPGRFPFTEMAAHEAICDFIPKTCPINQCDWRGCYKQMYSHFYEHHKPMTVVDRTIKEDIIIHKNMKMDFFIMVFDQYFMIRCEFRKLSKTFHCSIHLLSRQPNNGKVYQYEMMIKTKDGRYSWPEEMGIVQTDPILGRYLRNYECCIELSSLNCITRKPVHVTLRIRFIEMDEDEEEALESEEDLILETIRCPICLEYMVPPIHQCILGHSFCNICKPKLNKCPTCRQTIGSTRNYTLEKVAERVAFNCMYKPDGCNFKTDYANIQKHESICKFKISECPLLDIVECDYTGTHASMFQHCIEAHSNFVQRGPYFQLIYVPYFSNFEVFLIQYDFGLLFKLRYGYSDEKVMCSVQCVSQTPDDAIFMYEMEIVDLNDNGYELMSRKRCASLSDDPNDMRFCTIWHIDMVNPFILDLSQLKFKCLIFPLSDTEN